MFILIVIILVIALVSFSCQLIYYFSSSFIIFFLYLLLVFSCLSMMTISESRKYYPIPISKRIKLLYRKGAVSVDLLSVFLKRNPSFSTPTQDLINLLKFYQLNFVLNYPKTYIQPTSVDALMAYSTRRIEV